MRGPSVSGYRLAFDATVILSAVVPTLIATTFFEPRLRVDFEDEEVDAAEEIDAGPVIHRAPHHEPQVVVEAGPMRPAQP